MPDPLFRAHSLAFQYPGVPHPAFGPIDLEIGPGEIVLLLGPSGCGKSTLALCANGLIPQMVGGALTGELYVAGVDPRLVPVPEMTRRAGLVFQDPESQLCALTVADEVAFGPENLLIPADEVARRIERSLAAVGLAAVAPQAPPRALSGGQKQRLAMAAVLSLEPPLLVLDEPTAHLDPVGAHAFFERLDALRRETAAGILLIEHRVDEAAPLADRVVVMDARGRLRHEGPPRRVFGSLRGENAIWLPEASELAMRGEAAMELDAGPLPLTPKDLADRLVSILSEAYTSRSIPLEACVLREERMPAAYEALDRTSGHGHGRTVTSRPEERGPVLLAAEAVAYRYPDGAPALRSADLVLRRETIHALVGPNGSGKSTLALILAGLITPTAGQVTRVAGLRVGYVFQNPERQFVARTVKEELAYGLVRMGVSPDEVARRVAGMLARFRLEDVTGRHPFRLSGGQKRRLSVAAMLIEQPDLLILDEPTFGQDRETARSMIEEIRRLNVAGLTLLLISHDMRLVAETAHHVTALEAGRTRFNGTARDLFAQPDLCRELALILPPMAQLSLELRRRGIVLPDFCTQDEAWTLLSAALSHQQDGRSQEGKDDEGGGVPPEL